MARDIIDVLLTQYFLPYKEQALNKAMEKIVKEIEKKIKIWHENFNYDVILDLKEAIQILREK